MPQVVDPGAAQRVGIGRHEFAELGDDAVRINEGDRCRRFAGVRDVQEAERMAGLHVEGEFTALRTDALLSDALDVAEYPVHGHAFHGEPRAAVDPWSSATGWGDVDAVLSPAMGEFLQSAEVEGPTVVVQPEIDVGVRSMGAARATAAERHGPHTGDVRELMRHLVPESRADHGNTIRTCLRLACGSMLEIVSMPVTSDLVGAGDVECRHPHSPFTTHASDHLLPTWPVLRPRNRRSGARSARSR